MFENYKEFERLLTAEVIDIRDILKYQKEDCSEEEIKYYEKFAIKLMQLVNDAKYRNREMGLALEEILQMTK